MGRRPNEVMGVKTDWSVSKRQSTWKLETSEIDTSFKGFYCKWGQGNGGVTGRESEISCEK